MICYVDLEHERILQSPEEIAIHQARCTGVRLRLEAVSGEDCLVQRYELVTLEWLVRVGVKALIISGNLTDWASYDERDFLELYRVIRNAKLPILGICGGHQLIAMAHGTSLGPIRQLEESENDPHEVLGVGYFKEWGFVPMHVLKPDPLFDGLGEKPVFLAAHYWEIKALPPGFELLASSAVCRIQAMRHVGKLVYGVQFHPEAYVEGQGDSDSWLVDLVYPGGYAREQTDGRRLLDNFFRTAGI